MPQFLLLVVIALVIAAIVFGVAALVIGDDPGLKSVAPDGGSRGLPGSRPLVEHDLARVRFDVAFRGYRMSQVDAALARAAYDIGFKQEMIEALRAEVAALRGGRTDDAEALRQAREAASGAGAGRGEPAPDAKLPAPDTHLPAPDETARAEAVGLVEGEQADPGSAGSVRADSEPVERAQ